MLEGEQLIFDESGHYKVVSEDSAESKQKVRFDAVNFTIEGVDHEITMPSAFVVSQGQVVIAGSHLHKLQIIGMIYRHGKTTKRTHYAY